MSASFVFHFELDPHETVRVTKLLRRRAPWWWITIAVWPILIGLGVMYLATGAQLRDLWLLGVTAAILLLIRLLEPWYQTRQLRQLYRDTPSLRGTQTYEIDAKGLSITAGTAETTVGWDNVLKTEETDEFVLFFFAPRAAYYLPKRAPEVQQRLHGLRLLLQDLGRPVQPMTGQASEAGPV